MKMRWPQSIASSLVMGILIVSIMPLLLVSWYAYDNAVADIEKMQRNKLKDNARANVEFINNTFNQIHKNLEMWSQNEFTQQYLVILEKDFKHSTQSLKAFTRSATYNEHLKVHEEYLKNIKKTYDYVYDLFLIDLKGNILYTAAKEDDLGTNFINGPYQGTRFAQAFRASLIDKKAHFSDLEYYAASHGSIAGFVCTPMKDTTGKVIGVMGLQINLSRIIKKFNNAQNTDGIKHYLVGYEGLLRTPLNAKEEILKRRISSEQFWTWYREHALFGTYSIKMAEKAFVYQGPDGHKVLGQHNAINFLGVHWVQISEVDEKILHLAPNELANKIGLIVFLGVIMIVVMAILMARRITSPIKQLHEAALAYVNGNKDIKVVKKTNNEIGELAYAFQRMIDVQKQDEANLQELLNNLEDQKYALDSHSIVAITDVKGNITFVNKKFEEISGYSYEELIGKNHRMLNSGFHSLVFWTEMYTTVSNGKIWHNNIRNRAKDGQYYWVSTTIVPFMDRDGKPKSYIAIRTDVTEQIIAQEELKEALTLQKAIFDNAGTSIIITDTAGFIISVNVATQEMTGYASEEFIGQSPAMLHKLDEVVQRAKEFSIELNDSIEPGFEVFVVKTDCNMRNSHEWTYVRKDGSELSVYLTVTGLYDADGVLYAYMGMASDISVLKEAETQMMLAKDAAESSARSKSEFLAAMSHEIRTPMNGVLGMLELLENSKLDNTQRHRIHVAKSSATSLLGLINDILDFSKIEAGKMDLEKIEFNLRDELGEFAETIAFKAEEKGLEIILDTAEVHTQSIITDPGRLRQIMTNLIGNAVKFTRQGHILISASTKDIGNGHGMLRLDITDTGIGIDPEKINTLFDAFTQADGSTTRKYGGTGLGLSIVKRLCELMNGSVSATSIPNYGSTFSVKIEVELGENNDLAIPSISVENKTVLIVDDNEVNRGVVRAQLESWGMLVDEAEDALSAFDKCQIQISKGDIPPYNVALVDMQMPEMDGAQLGSEIRKISGCNEMKMVMMTSLGSRYDAQVFADLGFNAFFAKPTTAKDLLNALKVLFDDGEALQGANPLVTKDYLGTLKNEQSELVWPASTRILLVEDNLTNQLVAQGILENIGLHADMADNGLEALESLEVALETKPYTLVLMDCQMPEMDGYSASMAIRAGKACEANKKIPIIAMTANTMSGDREKCMISGMDDYISKPINLLVLKETLQKWLLKDEKTFVNAKDTIIIKEAVEVEDKAVDYPLWDEEGALSRLGNNQALLEKVVQAFVDDARDILMSLHEALQDNNSANAQLHAHSLKGSSGNVGALKLQDIGRDLEEAAKNKNMLDVEAGYAQCEEVLNETLELLKNYLSKIQKAVVQKKRLDPLQMAMKLQMLKKDIENGVVLDIDSLGIFVEYTNDVFNDDMNRLKNYLQHFETHKALETLNAIMESL